MLIELIAAMILTGADPDGVVATAPRGPQSVPAADAAMPVPAASPTPSVQTPHGLTTDQQISRWIGEGRAEASPPADPWVEAEERRMHGEFSVGVGTGGYRDYAAAVSMPLGENGVLNLSVRQSENAPWGYGYGYGYGDYLYGPLGPRFGVIEPPGFEGSHYRGRPLGALRARATTQQEVSVGFATGSRAQPQD